MTVLFIGPLPKPVTGQSLACQVLLDELIKRHPVDVVNLSKRDFSNGIDSLVRIREVLGFIWQAWRKSRTSDVIYFTISESISGNVKDLFIYLVCFKKLPQTVIHLHGGAGMRELMKPSNGIIRVINRFFLQRIGAIIVLGSRHVDIFNSIAPIERIHIVPNFAEDSLFVNEAAIKEKFSQVEPLRLLFLSNHLPGKGYIELLDAYLSLNSEIRARVQLDFAGGFQSDEQKNIFLKLIKNLSSVNYHGVVYGSKKAELFSNAHIFCLPTYYPYEGQPISILEAYASGCAVITTNHSGIFDIFTPNENGYCVDVRSSISISQTIEKAISNPLTLYHMALNNRQAAESLYRTKKFNDRLLSIIESITT